MLQPKVKSVKPLDNYMLFVKYENGEVRLFDVKPYMSGDWFSQLKDPNTFNTVHPRGSTVEWVGGQDIAPHELYSLSIPV